MHSVRWLVSCALVSTLGCSPSDPESVAGGGVTPVDAASGGSTADAVGTGGSGAHAPALDGASDGGPNVSSEPSRNAAGADASSGGGGEDGSAGRRKDAGAGGMPFVPQVVNGATGVVTDKIDLLFMIDNSSSMADKQEVLRQALPAIVNRLFHPSCLDTTRSRIVGPSQNGECAAGTVAEFQPPTDLHLGIIDSSLGSHGVVDLCNDSSSSAAPDAHNNDNGRLVARGFDQAPSSGFLQWSAGSDAGSLTGTLQDMVSGVGQHGCGYESQLESIYRFLVDPAPPAEVVLEQDSAKGRIIVARGVDNTVLSQRASFLRPDSLVVVVLVSDEDDCSLQEYGQAWLALAPPRADGTTLLGGGTSVCQTNPNDPCCFNCATTGPDGCPDPSSDPACSADAGYGYYTSVQNPSNLRCWRQKQRHGVDFRYDVKRYVDGFSQPRIVNRQGVVVSNPLFTNPTCIGNECPVTRDVGSFLFVAVVGVPWQDLARDPLDISKGYKSGTELEATHTWPIILGDPTAIPPVPPTDPLMIDSVAPRVATVTANPLGPAALPVTNVDAGRNANPINGHEWDTSKIFPQANSDLQYACVFDIPTPRDCSAAFTDCDCIDSTSKLGGFGPADERVPLCQDGAGAYGTTQYRAKAYPGLRELQVVRALGARGQAASICPATLSGNPNGPGYGYNPVVDLIVEHVGEHLPKPEIR